MRARGTGPLILKSSDVHDADMNLILLLPARNCGRSTLLFRALKPWHASIVRVSLQDATMELCPRIGSLR